MILTKRKVRLYCMKKYKRLLFLLSILGMLIPAFPSEAKIETTHEIQLIDMGHGIFVPSNFDVVDENGNFVTLSGIDPSYMEPQTVDEESYSIVLENGYRAEKEWFYDAGSKDKTKAYLRTTVYDTKGNPVFVLGCDIMGNVHFGMQDEQGNYVKNTYTNSVINKIVEGETVTFESSGTKNEDGTALLPLKRVTYDAQEHISKTYKKWGDTMQLHEKYDYSAQGGGTCTVYGKINTMYNSYDQEDEYYESYSYKKEDLQEYSARTLVLMLENGTVVYSPYTTTLPSKITQKGVELEIYWLENYFENANWDESSKNTPEILAGRPCDEFYYFTKEQIEIIEKEGITTVSQLQDKYPEFFETFGGFTDTYYGNHAEVQAQEQQQQIDKANEAIISEDEKTESKYDFNGEWYTLQDGTRECFQNIVGDVMEIDGKIPTWVVTQDRGSNGQIVTLYDDNGSIVKNFYVFDISHTDYKYVYISEINMNYDSIEIAGTNEPIGGNLNYQGEVTTTYNDEEVTGSLYGGEYSE